MASNPPTIYLLYGDQELGFAEFVETLRGRMGDPHNAEMNIERLSSDAIDLDHLEQVSTTLPFLSRRRLVILDQPSRLMKSESNKERFYSLLASLPQSTALVLVETIDFKSTRGRVPSLIAELIEWLEANTASYIRRYEVPHGSQFSQWIQDHAREQGGEIGPEAAQLLAESVSEDIQLAHQEVVKLLTYVGYQRPVEAADVEELTPFYGQTNVFDMVDAIGRRDASHAMQRLRRLLEDESALYIFAMVTRQFRLLIQAKAALQERKDPQQVLKISPFVAKKISAQAQNFSLSDLGNIYSHLLEMDIDSKTGKDDLEVSLERLIAQLAR